MSRKIAADGHLSDLDGFRALSILAVLAAHMLPLGPGAWQINFSVGAAGMSVFFALSGFLISRFLWDSQDVPTFFVRRMARIVPLVLLVSFLYCLFIESDLYGFIVINLYLQNYLMEALTPSVSPLWSVAVEMHFYIVIGLAIWIFGRRGFWLLPIGLIVVLMFRVAGEVHASIITHFRVDEILTGGVLALAWMNRHDSRVSRILAILPRLFWPIAILWALSCWPPVGPMGYARAYLAALLIGSVLMMEDRWQNRLLGTRTMAYIAAISFAIYVWHSPFRRYWFDSGSDLERYLFKRPLAFACIWALSHLSTFYFEKPITEAACRLRRRTEVTPALRQGRWT